jgi:hypothetical protein
MHYGLNICIIRGYYDSLTHYHIILVRAWPGMLQTPMQYRGGVWITVLQRWLYYSCLSATDYTVCCSRQNGTC